MIGYWEESPIYWRGAKRRRTMAAELIWDMQRCPSCFSDVPLGIMSLRATCYCGWWWNDVDKCWNEPETQDGR